MFGRATITLGIGPHSSFISYYEITCVISPALKSSKSENEQAYSEYKHVLANISRSRYVAIATQPMHRLQTRPTVHN